MDTKSLAKSKRAHSQHHKKHHPNQKAKGTTSSVVGPTGVDKAQGKVVKEKPRHPQGPPALPSNWDRYEDENENDPITEDQKDGQSSQPSDIVVPKSKGADYRYLISEAKSQNSTRSPLEIFPSLDDFVSDFGQGKDAFFTVRGESLLSSIQNDSFVVDDKKPASYEASFLSLNLQALSEQLAKIDLPKRLFMEADLFPPELYSEIEEQQKSSQGHDMTNRNELQGNNDYEVTSHDTTKSYRHHSAQDPTSSTGVNPMVQPKPNSNPKPIATPSVKQPNFKPEKAEAELDMLLDSFADTNLKETASTSKKTTIAIDIDDTLDDLLKETSTPSLLDQNGAPPSHEPWSSVGSLSNQSQPASKFEPGDDFDSWLDTI